ncbi:redoxin domain-containing protein [haloarchaeon 3A1-DGR]|nr:redoxin domain-containing protein [haloarchaeon 3A1-DGR]
MHVTVEVVGEGSRELACEPEDTYADLIRSVGYSPQEAAALVDGSPVPEDRAVDADRVTVLRLIKGGSGRGHAPETVDFEGANVGPGPDPFVLSGLESDLAVLLFHRDHLCGNCRTQVKTVVSSYDSLRKAGVEAVSILPEDRDRAAEWVAEYDVPYPFIADPETEIASQYGQSRRFGTIGRRIDLIGRMPEVVLVDLRREPEVLWRYTGAHPGDRPGIDAILEEVAKFA